MMPWWAEWLNESLQWAALAFLAHSTIKSNDVLIATARKVWRLPGKAAR